MTEAPERIWATEDAANFGEDKFHTTRPMAGMTEYIRADVAAARIADMETALHDAICENVGTLKRLAEVERQLAADAKAHEKEIAVWSENYAALERQLAEAREVKPLIWERHPVGWIAAPPTGRGYIIDVRRKGRVLFIQGIEPSPQFDTLEAAKADAQADYTARILSALKDMP